MGDEESHSSPLLTRLQCSQFWEAQYTPSSTSTQCHTVTSQPCLVRGTDTELTGRKRGQRQDGRAPQTLEGHRGRSNRVQSGKASQTGCNRYPVIAQRDCNCT